MIDIEMPNAKRGRPVLVDLTGVEENPDIGKRRRVSQAPPVPPGAGPAHGNYDVVDLIGGEDEEILEVPNPQTPIDGKRACRRQILEVFPGE